MPYSLKNSKVHSKKIAHLRKKYPIFELKETCINTQDCKKKYTGERNGVCSNIYIHVVHFACTVHINQ